MIPTTDGPLEIFVDIFIFEVSKINDIELTMTFELYFDLMWEEKRFVINETSDKWGQVSQPGDTNVYTRPGLMRQDKVTCCVNRPQCLLKSTIILKPWDLDSHHQNHQGVRDITTSESSGTLRWLLSRQISPRTSAVCFLSLHNVYLKLLFAQDGSFMGSTNFVKSLWLPDIQIYKCKQFKKRQIVTDVAGIFITIFMFMFLCSYFCSYVALSIFISQWYPVPGV